jgi:hypothetical protein
MVDMLDTADLVKKSMDRFEDEELRAARISMNVRNFLQERAVRLHQSVLNVDDTLAELLARFRDEELRLLGWGDMFMLDMMYFKRGGNYRMDAHNRPREGDTLTIGGELHYVYETSFFTFSAASQTEMEEAAREVADDMANVAPEEESTNEPTG